MNEIYNSCNLFSGKFDGQTIEPNLKSHLKNVLIELLAYFFLINNLISFLFDINSTDSKLIYLTSIEITDKFGAKYVNLVSNLLVLLTIVFPIRAFKKLINQPKQFELFQFLFCEDVNLMQRKFHLNEKLAKRQIKYQILFQKHINLSNKIYGVILFGVILKYTFKNVSELSFGLLFIIKLVICFLLYIETFKSSLIILLMTTEFNLSCFYLANHLSTLISEISSLSVLNVEPRKMNKKLLTILNGYSNILLNQKSMNNHFDKSLIFLQMCNGL